MIAASVGEGEATNDDGIISGHAYSLISVHEIDFSKETVRLLKLRNPWGQTEWKGAWSDGDLRWNPDLRE